MERQFFWSPMFYGGYAGYGMGFGAYPSYGMGYGSYPYHHYQQHHGFGGYPFHHQHGFGGSPYQQSPWTMYREELDTTPYEQF